MCGDLRRTMPEFPLDWGSGFGEIDAGIVAIKSSPGSAGHFLDLGSSIVPEVRRRNLHAFPFSFSTASSATT